MFELIAEVNFAGFVLLGKLKVIRQQLYEFTIALSSERDAVVLNVSVDVLEQVKHYYCVTLKCRKMTPAMME